MAEPIELKTPWSRVTQFESIIEHPLENVDLMDAMLITGLCSDCKRKLSYLWLVILAFRPHLVQSLGNDGCTVFLANVKVLPHRTEDNRCGNEMEPIGNHLQESTRLEDALSVQARAVEELWGSA